MAGCGGLGALGAEDRDVVGGGAASAVGGDLGLELCGQGAGVREGLAKREKRGSKPSWSPAAFMTSEKPSE